MPNSNNPRKPHRRTADQFHPSAWRTIPALRAAPSLSFTMNDSIGARSSYERLTIPTIWAAFALSLLFHALGLFGWIAKAPVPFQEPKLGKPSDTLAIRLVEPKRAAPSVSREAPEPPAPPPPTARRKVPPPQAPKSAVTPTPQERLPRIPPLDRSPAPVAPPPEAPRAAPTGDLASFVASRRRERGDPAPVQAQQAPPETEQQRHNRVVAENLGLTKTPTFGNDPARGDGVFTVRSMAFDTGEFAFYGWNKAIGRDSLQVIEVRRGGNENMEIAMVRRMILVIRELSAGDFLWQSRRLGKGVWLSARPQDTAELEAFMLREIFPDPRAR